MGQIAAVDVSKLRVPDAASCQERGLFACCAADDPSDGRTDIVVSGSVLTPRNQGQRNESDEGGSGGGSGGSGISLDLVLSDLERAEEITYGQAYADFPAPVMLDTPSLRDFALENCAISQDDLDLDFMRMGATLEDGVSLEVLLLLLRENAVPEALLLNQFLSISGDGEHLGAEECRQGLYSLGTREMGAQFTEEQWDRILMTVMMECDSTVMMDQWIVCSKRIARIIRLTRYAGLLP
eukprot:gnl/TRDRNA2_/TRDRNA2_48584_c0_seq1.p1 gnl/TRDRNA2_/TRDRNA2_48584_c0~~gnl/TRDRNA2_/TRDRNA2_48584_c0_seq1.p1  ORF type:complete len:254 (-),score=40.44 gnl/TRDRNA2_/TRDRNA2_48584_c0_seq1:15-731(-)